MFYIKGPSKTLSVILRTCIILPKKHETSPLSEQFGWSAYFNYHLTMYNEDSKMHILIFTYFCAFTASENTSIDS